MSVAAFIKFTFLCLTLIRVFLDVGKFDLDFLDPLSSFRPVSYWQEGSPVHLTCSSHSHLWVLLIASPEHWALNDFHTANTASMMLCPECLWPIVRCDGDPEHKKATVAEMELSGLDRPRSSFQPDWAWCSPDRCSVPHVSWCLFNVFHVFLRAVGARVWAWLTHFHLRLPCSCLQLQGSSRLLPGCGMSFEALIITSGCSESRANWFVCW